MLLRSITTTLAPFEIASTASEVTKPTLPAAFEQTKERRITFSSVATATLGDRWTIYIDGVEYTYITQLGDTNAQISKPGSWL